MNTRKRVNRHARDQAEQFDTTLLHNRVYEQVQGAHDTEHDLTQIIDLADGCFQFAEEWRDDCVEDPVGSAAFGAAEALNDQIDAVVDEQIATACAVVATDAQEWTDAWDADELAAARHEACEWLQNHLDAAERAGVLDDVTGIEREVEA
jgi:hypothetical protein